LRQQLAVDATLRNTIHALQRRIGEQKDVPTLPLDPTVSGADVLAEYEQLKSSEEQLTSQRLNLQREIDNMSVWGDFDLEMLRKFEEAGRQIKFYSCRDREFQADWPEKFDAVEIARRGAIVYFVTVTPAGFDEEPDAEKMRISDSSLGQLQTALSENKSRAEDVKKQIDVMIVEHLNNLKEMQRQLNECIDWDKVNLQAEKKADEKLILLEGWVPEVKELELIEALQKQDAYYVGASPDKDEKKAPILLKNNKYARLFEPIGKMYDLPNYHELDLTPFFAPFFMLFFGICLCDAGYGLLLLIAALIARPRVSDTIKPIVSLVAILGGSAMVCGTILGGFFGIELLHVEWAWIKKFQKFMLDSDQLFNLALMIGAAQIIFGMFVKAFGRIRRYGFLHSLETWGWLLLILGGGALFAMDIYMKKPWEAEIE
jgi:V/A-type H+-transporting ATPase subunit I